MHAGDAAGFTMNVSVELWVETVTVRFAIFLAGQDVS